MTTDSIRKNAENEIDFDVRNYMQRHGVKYREAFLSVMKAKPDLAKRYAYGSDAVVTKKYDGDTLTPAQKEMAILVADAGKVQTLAGWRIDELAREQLRNVGAGVPDPVDAYRRALDDVRKKYPSLARAALDGFIDNKDFQLLGLLIPSLAGEIQRGNYRRNDSTRCACGKNKALCRGDKLAALRKVHESNVQEYAKCILDARSHGTALDEIRCLY
jgi:hypothetical protein